uniref:Uncharacterized protein n=1 Tax=Arundo donax TaxID=35708 RepID=A0A0A8YBF1_ARUDO
MLATRFEQDVLLLLGASRRDPKTKALLKSVDLI